MLKQEWNRVTTAPGPRDSSLCQISYSTGGRALPPAEALLWPRSQHLECLLLLFLLLLERLVFSAVASPWLPQGLLATFVADRAPAPPWTLPPGPNEHLFSDKRRSFGAGWATRGQVTVHRRSRSFKAAASALPLCALLA